MSIYTDCRTAAKRLLQNPSFVDIGAYAGISGVFTELDVVVLGHELFRWTPEQIRVAQRETSQVMGGLFRQGDVARFGPVSLPGVDDPDYVRVATKILYTSPDGPASIETPNGIFARLWVHQDPITRQGRRLGSNRTDLKLWSEQEILTVQTTRSSDTPNQREVIRLKTELAASQKRAQTAESEVLRLREHRAKENNGSLTRAEIEEIVLGLLAELEGRISSLEQQPKVA